MKALGPLILVVIFLFIIALACCYPGDFQSP